MSRRRTIEKTKIAAETYAEDEWSRKTLMNFEEIDWCAARVCVCFRLETDATEHSVWL